MLLVSIAGGLTKAESFAPIPARAELFLLLSPPPPLLPPPLPPPSPLLRKLAPSVVAGRGDAGGDKIGSHRDSAPPLGSVAGGVVVEARLGVDSHGLLQLLLFRDESRKDPACPVDIKRLSCRCNVNVITSEFARLTAYLKA